MGEKGTLIKWPGGKSREIKHIEKMIPDYDRYVEPFFGGGAMYFYLQPKKASINDISGNLMDFYTAVKHQDKEFQKYLCAFHLLMNDLLLICDRKKNDILSMYLCYKERGCSEQEEKAFLVLIKAICQELFAGNDRFIVLNENTFEEHLVDMVTDKIRRTVDNEKKNPFNEEDLVENLITGFMSGMYMYFRSVYNDILLGRLKNVHHMYATAVFYYIREYCYGSMFRYNKKGEFNIPYGGMSYNRKDFGSKIEHVFSDGTKTLFENTDIHCSDFEAFLDKLTLSKNDFVFLDPPYDTEFSDYDGKVFTRDDQCRLAKVLRQMQAKFILVIKNTEFVYSLYEKDFKILCFDKTYSYNVRQRNNRNAEHLIITNMDV